MYSWLSLSRIPRDPLKYFEISVARHIRFAEVPSSEENIIPTTTFSKFLFNLTFQFRYIENIVEIVDQFLLFSTIFFNLL